MSSPFHSVRSDHTGALRTPDWLRDLYVEHHEGRIDTTELRTGQVRAVGEVIRRQELLRASGHASLLDYEKATSHSITVRVTDSAGATATTTFNWIVTNLALNVPNQSSTRGAAISAIDLTTSTYTTGGSSPRR